MQCLTADQKYPDCSTQRWLFSNLIQTVANIANIATVFAPSYEIITGCEEKKINPDCCLFESLQGAATWHRCQDQLEELS